MAPTVAMIVMMATSAGLRVALGARHPLALVPLIAACAIWFSQTRDSWWQWAFLGLGAVLIGIAIRLAMESFEDRRGRTGAG
ncbi:MAG: hypothetical protein R2702_03165 [Acidimicrobiales bacterium]